jgi:hypothetical protein
MPYRGAGLGLKHALEQSARPAPVALHVLQTSQLIGYQDNKLCAT